MLATHELTTPVSIPETSRVRYISFMHALNIALPDEDTGDWHFRAYFFDPADQSRAVLTAGEGERVNSNPGLGGKGIRDMAGVLRSHGIDTDSGPVFVANHFRAVADIALSSLLDGRAPRLANSEINAWFNTPEEIAALLDDYLAPIRAQVQPDQQGQFDQWLSTIQYQS